MVPLEMLFSTRKSKVLGKVHTFLLCDFNDQNYHFFHLFTRLLPTPSFIIVWGWCVTFPPPQGGAPGP